MYVSFNCDKNLFFILIFLLTSIIILYKGLYFFNSKRILFSFSQSFLIILYLIEKKLSKIDNIQQRVFSEKTKKEPTYKKYLLIFFSVIFYFISSYIDIIIQEENIIISRNIQMCFFLIIDILIFKEQRYSHQILLTIPFLIIGFLFFGPTFYLQLLYIILRCYSYAFSFLLVKYINTKYFISVYIFSFIFGLLEFILLLPRGISFLYYFYYDSFEIIYLIGLIVNNYFFFYILYKLSPVHSNIFQCIGIILVATFYDEPNNFQNLLFSIIVIIFSLIYLEIIELNFVI